MIYARIEADNSITLVDLDPALIAKWAAETNPKAILHRAYVIDAQPTPSATEKVVSAGYVIEPTQVRKTWALLTLNAAELEAADLQAEKAQIDGYITDINTQLAISNADRALLTNVQRINELEKDSRAGMKAIKYLLRQAKQAS
jgi:hypothetical protein